MGEWTLDRDARNCLSCEWCQHGTGNWQQLRARGWGLRLHLAPAMARLTFFFALETCALRRSVSTAEDDMARRA